MWWKTILVGTGNSFLGNRSTLYPPASEASREVTNLTERKKSAYLCIWCQRICVCLSVCLSVCLFVCLSFCEKVWFQLSQDWLNRMNKKIRIGPFWAVWQKWAILRPHFWTKVAIFFRQTMGTQIKFYKCYNNLRSPSGTTKFEPRTSQSKSRCSNKSATNMCYLQMTFSKNCKLINWIFYLHIHSTKMMSMKDKFSSTF